MYEVIIEGHHGAATPWRRVVAAGANLSVRSEAISASPYSMTMT
jgi:hypothetical protein